VIAADSGVWRGLGAGLFDLSAARFGVPVCLTSIWEIPALWPRISNPRRPQLGFVVLVRLNPAPLRIVDSHGNCLAFGVDSHGRCSAAVCAGVCF